MTAGLLPKLVKVKHRLNMPNMCLLTNIKVQWYRAFTTRRNT